MRGDGGAAVERVLAALRAHGSRVEGRGGSWMAQCPSHEDGTASLSITRGATQPVALVCLAGCATDDVLAAIGLTYADVSAPASQRADVWTPAGPAVAVYDYTDEAGRLLFQVLRTAGKEFRQRRPDPGARSGWKWSTGGVRRVLYRLPQVIEAVGAGQTIWIAEGEKDVEALERAGVVATCNPGGAGKWRGEYDRVLAGADVRIVQDRDEPGRKHGLAVAEGLRRAGCTVTVCEALAGKDATDHLAAGHSLDSLSVVQSDPAPRSECAPGAEAPREGRSPSQATQIRQLAHERYRLIRGDDGQPYAVAITGPNIARPLRGKSGLRSLLARLYADAHRGSVPSQGALTDAITALEGDADGADSEPMHLRVAPYDGGVVLDLGTPDGRCVVVRPGGGWRIESRSPVLFRRTQLVGTLPDPLHGSTMDGLRDLLNVDDYQWPVIVGWLLAALKPDCPHPILALLGEQGTAKSSAARMLMLLIDASPAPLRSPPRDLKNWAVQAAASWTVCLDNVSTIPPWLSDTLCKAVTGDGLVDRALFSDGDVHVLAFKRVVALTGIDTGALRGDLAERLLPVDLARIGDESRRAEESVAAAYADARPGALGALLTLLSDVLGRLPAISLDRMPRMADFTRVLAALDEVTGWESRAAYERTAEDVAESVIGSDQFADAVRHLLDRLDGEWEGTTSELLGHITPEKPPRSWPGSAQAARGELRRVAPALRRQGYVIEPLPRTSRSRPWRLAPPPHNEGDHEGESSRRTSSSSSPSSLTPADLPELSDDPGDDAVTMLPGASPSSHPSSPRRPARDLRKQPARDDGDDGDDGTQPFSAPPGGMRGASFWASADGEEWSA